jgi:hypothetical protein
VAIEVMSWVWNHSRSRNGARLVLLAIADSCNDSDGTGAWPAVGKLMQKANLSERAVQNATKELEALGELKVEWKKGPNGSNKYTVLMGTPADSAGAENGTSDASDVQTPPQILHPADSAPPQNLRGTKSGQNRTLPTRKPAESAPPQILHPADSAPNPSFSSSSKKRTNSSSSTRKAKAATEPHPRFAEFWAAYPLRVSIGDARAAFAKAIEAGADPDELIAAAGRYARHCQRTNKERGYIRHGATWLNKESWLDDLGPDEDPAPGAVLNARSQPSRTSGVARAMAEGAERHDHMRALDEANDAGQNTPSPFDMLPIPGSLR